MKIVKLLSWIFGELCVRKLAARDVSSRRKMMQTQIKEDAELEPDSFAKQVGLTRH